MGVRNPLMKFLIILFTLVAGGAQAITSLPTGKYVGTGRVWTTLDGSAPYKVSMEFRGNTYVEDWSSATRKGLLHVSVQFEPHGRLTMTIKESSHGAITGYCGDNSCHVEGIATNGARYEQTFFFEKDKIRKTGSETSADKTTMWESTLNLTPDPTVD